MAFMEKLIGKKDDLDMEEFLNNLDSEESDPYEGAEALVKPVNMGSEEDVKVVLEEAKKGNILLVNIGDMSKRNQMKLKELLGAVKDGIDSIDGDIARVSQEKIIVTP